ncbi:pentapeptide repeat-containing protein [Streptomyces sp. NPDC059218]|uniref:pentapeptide repeat-containing protein n=1 Tax=unclassified Streptomyces TaxID=2593676 RepID=UPI0036CA2D46
MTLLAGAAGLVVLGAVFVLLPGVVVDHDLAGASVAAQDRLKAVNDVRTTLLQVVGGLVVFFGAYATWRQLRVSQDGLRATQEGYVTDRFRRAVDQLGSDKLDVRIGGLHALWRIAEQSWVNLSITDLRRADCDGLWFPEVNFDRACLEAAGLYHANLTQASLVSVNLRHADLTTAILRRARCILADLRGREAGRNRLA